MARPKKDKDPFEDLPEDWQDAVAAASDEEINKRIAELAKAEEENQKAKKDDQDLAEKKGAVKIASEGYREANKMYKLKMKYVMSILEGRGKA